MITYRRLEKMFVRQELSEGKGQISDEVEKKCYELARFILDNVRPNNALEEAMLHLKKASMMTRVAIAMEDDDTFEIKHRSR